MMGMQPAETMTVVNRREVHLPSDLMVDHGPEPVRGHPTPGTHLWGWMTVPELEWLYQQAQDMESIVEIGSLHGRSAFALGQGCLGPVYCIDPWNDEHDLCYGSFLRNTEGLTNIHPIRGFSPSAGAQVPGDVDMVFIDGDHSREGIQADIDYWYPRTKKLICGHDYLPEDPSHYPDVTAVVDEMFGDEAEHIHDTKIWAVVPDHA